MPSHAELVRIAEAAAPGPWASAAVVGKEHMDARVVVAGTTPLLTARKTDADHIATWHPSRALAALAVIEAAEHHLARHDPRSRQSTTELRKALAAWDALDEKGLRMAAIVPSGVAVTKEEADAVALAHGWVAADDVGLPPPGADGDYPDPEVGMEC